MAVVASVALGVGANSAIYSLIHQLLRRPLPVPEPERLVNLRSPGYRGGSTSTDQVGSTDSVFSYPLFRDLEREARLLSVAGHRSYLLSAAHRGEPIPVPGLFVSGGYFPVLQLEPAHGRLLGPEDDRGGAHPVAVLAHAYWQSRFGGMPGVLGEALQVDEQPLTIVGVAPSGFAGTTLGLEPQIYLPLALRDAILGEDTFENRRSHWVYAFGRLEPEVSRSEAAAALEPPFRALLRDVEAPLQGGLDDEALGAFRARRLLLDEGAHGQSRIRERVRTPLLALFGATGLILLIACANVANLLLARGVGLAGETAVRASLGASRVRLVKGLLGESLLLAAVGGCAGLLVARWTLDLLSAIPGVPFGDTTLQRPALAFCAAVALATGVVAGLFPALQASRPDLVGALKGQAPQGGGSSAARRFRAALVAGQMALSLTLLGPAALLFRSLENLEGVDLGLDPEGVVSFGLSPERSGYAPGAAMALIDRVAAEMRWLPGVESVGVAQVPLLAGGQTTSNLSVEGFEGPDSETQTASNRVGEGFFETLGIPLLAGRDFVPGDALGAPKVAIVDQAFAGRFGLSGDVLGKRMSLGSGGELDVEIVGLVGDARHLHPRDAPEAHFFFPYRQDEHLGTVAVYARGLLGSEALLRAVPEVVARVDPNLPIEGLRTLEAQVERVTEPDRAMAALAVGFAALATSLAALGLYGVLAFAVARRRREIGVRMALGADARRVRGLVLGQVGRLALAGSALGIGAAVALGRLIESVLFGLRGDDPATLLGAAALLGSVALLAGLLPALRACRIDPARALRAE